MVLQNCLPRPDFCWNDSIKLTTINGEMIEMRLTIYTDYALRTLIYLGVHRDRLCTIGEIAARYVISKNHLLKVGRELAAGGFVETVRGNGGGLRLARSPHLINIGDVVRQTEPDMDLVGCFDASGPGCRIEGACKLHDVLSVALSAFMAELDTYTLADLMVNRPQLVDKLASPIKWHQKLKLA